MWQVAYTAEAWANQARNPQNRVELVRPVVEKLGGRIEGAWLSFGEYDVVVILQMPDNVSQAALSIAGAAAGHLKAISTTPLMTVEEGLEAMSKAGALMYPSPTNYRSSEKESEKQVTPPGAWMVSY